MSPDGELDGKKLDLSNALLYAPPEQILLGCFEVRKRDAVSNTAFLESASNINNCESLYKYKWVQLVTDLKQASTPKIKKNISRKDQQVPGKLQINLSKLSACKSFKCFTKILFISTNIWDLTNAFTFLLKIIYVFCKWFANWIKDLTISKSTFPTNFTRSPWKVQCWISKFVF